MKYRIYTTSHKAWDGMFRAISSAQSSIYIEMYILLGDTKKTHDFIGLLKAKAMAGLKVVIIADAFGSADLDRKTVESIRSAGAEFLYFHSFFRRTHRKLVIIDGKIAFLGGVNIEEKIRDWRDLQIKVQGKIIFPLLRSFAKMYQECGGRNKEIKKFATIKPVRKLKSWIVDNIPGTNRIYYLNNYYREKIAGANSCIQIITPYLSPPRWLLSSLSNAIERGIKVEIILPQDTDIKIINRVNYANAARLTDIGASIYLSQEMNHAKAMIIDDKEGIIGSQNLDVLSFGVNKEIGIFFTQKHIIENLSALFKRWKGQAKLFSNVNAKIPFTDRALLLIIKIFYPIF